MVKQTAPIYRLHSEKKIVDGFLKDWQVYIYVNNFVGKY